MSDDTISRRAAIDAVHKDYDTILDFRSDGATVASSVEDILSVLPSTQSELEKKILEIGYTGKEGRIYIGGRLFAVRELAQ